MLDTDNWATGVLIVVQDGANHVSVYPIGKPTGTLYILHVAASLFRAFSSYLLLVLVGHMS